MFAAADTLLDSIADATRLRDHGLTLVALATADAMEAAAFGAVGLRSSRSSLRTHTPTLAGDAGEAESVADLLVRFPDTRAALEEHLGRPRKTADASGARIRLTAIAEKRDEVQRTQETVLRYERILGDKRDVDDRPWTLHWHTQDGFRSLAEEAGLRVSAVLDGAVRRRLPTT